MFSFCVLIADFISGTSKRDGFFIQLILVFSLLRFFSRFALVSLFFDCSASHVSVTHLYYRLIFLSLLLSYPFNSFLTIIKFKSLPLIAWKGAKLAYFLPSCSELVVFYVNSVGRFNCWGRSNRRRWDVFRTFCFSIHSNVLSFWLLLHFWLWLSFRIIARRLTILIKIYWFFSTLTLFSAEGMNLMAQSREQTCLYKT